MTPEEQRKAKPLTNKAFLETAKNKRDELLGYCVSAPDLTNILCLQELILRLEKEI